MANNASKCQSRGKGVIMDSYDVITDDDGGYAAFHNEQLLQQRQLDEERSKRMPVEPKDNEISIFPNKYKDTDTKPDMTGRGLVNGQEYRVSAWNNTARATGAPYIKMRFTAVDGAVTYGGNGGGGGGGSNDDLPEALR